MQGNELFEIVENGSRAHGPTEAVLTTMRRLGFFQLINSRPSRERDRVVAMVAMVAARILKPQSKLATTRWWMSTTLAEQLGVEQADEDELYDVSLSDAFPHGSYEVLVHNGTGGPLRVEVVAAPPAATAEFDVAEFAAMPDDGNDDAPTIPGAVDAAAEAGSGIVHCPEHSPQEPRVRPHF